MTAYVYQSLQRERHRASLENIRLNNVNPISYIHKYKVVNDFIFKKILIIMRNYAKNTQSRLKRLEDTLVALNPMAILQRGYSITRTVAKGDEQIIMNSDLVDIDQQLEILLAKGLLRVKVKDKFKT
jgi:exodeoxyribonuclease VII large subunit